MAKKIGEMLVEKGVITPDQLRAALRVQLARGGHLGTCLIEMNYLDEEGLGRMLAEIHRVECATAEQFFAIPQSVIDCVPRPVVKRHRVVPINVEDNALQVAMINPSDLLALKEVEFATGLNICPLVSPEVRIVFALERYYGISRSRRFLQLNLARRFLQLNLARVEQRPGLRTTPKGRESISVIPFIDPSDVPSGHVPEVTAATAMVSGGVPPSVPLPAIREDAESGKILRELLRQIPLDTDATRPTREIVVSEAGLLREFEQISDVLGNAASPSVIAQAVLDCAARGLSRCILLVVRHLEARIWDWRGAGLDPAIVAGVRFPVDAQGIFELVAGRDWYRGEIPQESSCLQFYRELGLAVPTEALIVPVYFEETLAAILYGDGGHLGCIVGETDLYHRLARKMGIALSLVATKLTLQQA